MKRKEVITQINTILNNAMDSAKVYLLYQGSNGDISYNTFIVTYLKINSATIENLTGTLEWLENNRYNNLPNNSSGSMFASIIDSDSLFPDNIVCNSVVNEDTGEMEDWSEEEQYYAETTYNDMFGPLIAKQ